jgi:type IV pilus assembly protein PilE
MSCNRGITLVELLICMTIIALIAAWALPSQRAAVQKTRRGEARDALLQIQILQERHYFEHGRYASSLQQLEGDAATGRSLSGYYLVAVQGVAEGQGFRARAEPAPDGPQASDEDCRLLMLDDTGARSAAGSADADRRCWS